MDAIYCDMDGVLVDFKKGYYDLTKIDTSKYVKGDHTFWAPVDKEGPQWWANLDWMPDGKILWDYIKPYKPHILSSPSKSISSKVGKEAWCKININNQYKNLLLYPRHEKQLFSGKFSVLIDDLEETIKEWNKHGGIGIHHTSAADTIKQLKELGYE
jgi:hypothetical protein